MSGTDVETIVRKILEGSRVYEEVAAMSKEGLEAVLLHLREGIKKANSREEVQFLAKTLAHCLLSYGAKEEGPVGLSLSDVASSLASLAQDEEAKELSRGVKGLKAFDPKVLAQVYDRFGEELSKESRERLLRALVALSESPERERFLALLAPKPAQRPEEVEVLERAKGLLEGGEPEEALKLLERYLDKHGTDREALWLISRALNETGRSKKIEAWYARALAAVEDERERLGLLLDKAFAQHRLLLNPEAARTTFLAILEGHPTHVEALKGLVEACKATNKTQEAISVLEQARQKALGQPEEASILPLLANLYHEMGRLEEAERVWRRLRALDPRNLDALRFYEHYHEVHEDYQKLYTTLQFALSVVEDTCEKVRINKKMARIAEDHLHNLEKALDAHKRVLALDPSDRESEAAVVALYEKTKKWHALIEFYNERIRRLPDDAVDEKVALLFKIIEIYQDPERLPSEENVLATYARIAEISPTNREVLETLQKGYESRERWPDLFRVLQKKVALTEDPNELLELFHRIAQIAIERMSNETQAIPFLERILELDPQNLDVVKRLKAIYQRKHNQEKLFALTLKELKILEGQERIQALSSAAAMARDRLLRYEDALKLYEELYALDPNNREARESLHSLYARLERWGDYARFLSEEVERPMPEKRRTELRHKLGAVLLDKLGDLQGARRVFEKVLEADPDDDLARRRLEEIYLELEDLEALKRLFEGRGALRSFVALLSQRESRETDPQKKVQLNLAMADVCEHDLKDPVRAAQFLAKAWSLDRSLVEVGMRLLSLYEAQGREEEVAETLKALAPSLEDPSERLWAYSRLHACLERLGRPKEAFEAIHEAVRIANMIGSDPTRLIESASQTAKAGGLWSEYARLLEEAAEATMDGERRKQLLLELGQVYENRLLYHDEARRVLEQVLDLDPANPVALGLLEDIALQQEDYTALEGILRRRIDVATDPSQARDILLRLGRLYEDLIGDDLAAADCYAQILESHPDDLEVLSGLHRTYERSERFMELADVIRMEIAATKDLRQKVRLKCELARVCLDHLEDYEEALKILREVLEETGSEEAVLLLWEMFRRGLARDRAANILAPFLRATGRYDELRQLLVERLEDLERPEAKAAILMEIADIDSHIKNDDISAFNNVAQAVSLSPADLYVARLFELAEKLGRLEEAAKTVGEWVGIVPDGLPLSQRTLPEASREARLCLMLGRLYAGPLGRPDLAIRAYEKALPFEMDDESLLRDLIGLYRRVGDWDSLLATYDRLANVVASDEVRREVLLEKARAATEASRSAVAAETLESLLEGNPKDEEAFTLLEEVLSSEGNLGRLAEVIARLVSTLEPSPWRTHLLYELALLEKDHLGDYGAAASHLRACLLDEPQNLEARLQAEALIIEAAEGVLPPPTATEIGNILIPVVEPLLRESGEDPLRLVKVLEAKALLSREPWEKAAIYCDIAEIHEGASNAGLAFDALVKALEVAPDDALVLERLLSTGEKAQRYQELADVLVGVAEKAGPQAKTRLLLTAARLYRGPLGQPERASSIYDELLEVQPGSIPILREMDELLHEMGREAERIPLLREMAEYTHLIDEKRAIYLTIGELCEATGDLEGAVEAYRYALDRRPFEDKLDDTARLAAERLLPLYSSLGRLQKLVEIRLLLGRTTPDPDEARGHLLIAADITFEELKDAKAARAIYDELLERNPYDFEVLERAKEVAREMGDLDGLQKLIEKEVEAAEDEETKIEALLALADVLKEKGDEGCLRVLGEVLQTRPSHEGAQERLLGMLEREDLSTAAAKLLLETGERVSNEELVVAALRALSASEEDPRSKAIILDRLFESLLRLGRAEEALDAISRAYLLDPQSPAIFEHLVDALSKASRLSDLVAITLKAVESDPDLRLRSAAVLLKEGYPQEAASLAEENLKVDGHHRASLELLANAYEALGRKKDLASILAAQAQIEERTEEKVALLIKCAKVLESEGETREAIETYQKVIDLVPLHEEAISRLEALLVQVSDRKSLRDLYEYQLYRVAGQDERRTIELRRALAVMALEDGLAEEAIAHALEIAKAPMPKPDDLTVVRRVYSETGLPPTLFYALERAYEATVQREELLDFYRFVAGLEVEEPSKEYALRKVAEMEEALGLPTFDTLQDLLLLRPDDRDLRARFVAQGRKLGRLEEALEVLKSCFAACQDEDLGYEIAIEIGRILKEDLGREEEAADFLRLAFLRRPEDKRVVEELAEVYEKLSRYGDLALLYEHVGDATTDRAEMVSWYFKAYEVYRLKVRDLSSALEILKKVLDAEPENRTALDAMEAIAKELNDSATLAQILARKAEMAPSIAEKARTLLELATLQEEVLEDVASAILTLEEVLAECPGPGPYTPEASLAVERLKDLYLKTGRYEALADLFEAEAERVVTPEKKIEALKKAAAVRESKLGDKDMAKALLRRILSYDPTNVFAFNRLDEMLQEEGDFQGLAELLEGRLKHVESSSEQARLHVRLGDVMTHYLSNGPLAVTHYKAALAIDPYQEEARQGLWGLVEREEVAMEALLALEAVYESADDGVALCEVLERQLALVESEIEREVLLLRIADIRERRLHDLEGAFEAVGKAFRENPSNRDTLERLQKMAKELHLTPRLYQVLRDVAPSVGDRELRSRLNLVAAEIADRDLKDLEAAARHYTAFLEDNPGNLEVLQNLERIYSELGRAERLAEVLRQRIGLASSGQRASLRLRLADILTLNLGDIEGAIEQYKSVLEERPADREVIRRLSNLVDHPHFGRQALDLMIGALREAKDDGGLLWAIERLLAIGEADVDVVSLHCEAAEVARRLGDSATEVFHLGEAVRHAVSDERLVERFIEAALRAERFEEAYKVLHEVAGSAGWHDLEKRLRLAAADMAMRAGGKSELVEAELKRVLEIDPLSREALSGLERHYVQEGRLQEQTWILEQQLKLDMSSAERLSTLKRLAEVHEVRREYDKAALALEEAVSIDPTDMGALQDLLSMYEKQGDAKGQVSVLERLAAASTKPDEAASYRLKMADILAKDLQDLEASRVVLEGLLSEDPKLLAARRRLREIYEAVGDFRALLDLLSQVVGDEDQDKGTRIEAAMKAASVAESKLGDLVSAFAFLARAIELDPTFIPLHDEAIRLAYRMEDWGALVKALRAKAEVVRNTAEKVNLLSKASEVARVHIKDMEMASAFAREVLALDPRNPQALLTVAQVMEAKGQVEEALDLYRRLASSSGDVSDRVEALKGVARILMPRLGLTTVSKEEREKILNEVREALRTAARHKPGDPEVSAFLKKLYLENKEFQSVVEVLQQDLKRARTDAERASICMDIAEIFLNELNDGAKFLQWAEEAHRYRKDDPRIVAGLVNFYLKTGQSTRALPYLEWLVNYLEGKRQLKELPPYAHELGRIFEARGEIDKAIDYYRMCYEYDATNIENSLALGRLYLSRKEYEKALRVYQPLVVRIDSLTRPVRVEVLLAMAQIMAGRGDKKKAKQYVMRVLAEEPENADARALEKML